ncbi:hypothetical protein GCM10017714_06590 [Curtobacterium pusillum]|nr:hypothetical protein GCM10017610_02070 [Curtobacterium pusillum]
MLACGFFTVMPPENFTVGAVVPPNDPVTVIAFEAEPGSGQDVIAAAVALDDALGVADESLDPDPEHAASPSTTAGTRAIGRRRRRFTRT